MKLSVIISNRNDTSMLAVTVRSCIEELKSIGLSDCEIVICDNSDEKIYNSLSGILPTAYINEGLIKLIRQPFPCLFTAREEAIRQSSGKYIACVDSHMIIGHNMFLDLYNFMENHQDDETIGFAHAPINWAHQHERSSRHDRDMSVNELGDWGLAYRNERTITWKGMPWICKREWFISKEGLNGYGALSQHKLSWGGGDMHIGIKPWLLGFKNWAVPTSPGIHIGPFPSLDDTANPKVNNSYRLWSKSGQGPHTLGFLVSCYVLGGEPMMNRNKEVITKRFGQYLNIDKSWDLAKRLGKVEKAWLDGRKTTSFEELLTTKPWDN